MGKQEIISGGCLALNTKSLQMFIMLVNLNRFLIQSFKALGCCTELRIQIVPMKISNPSLLNKDFYQDSALCSTPCFIVTNALNEVMYRCLKSAFETLSHICDLTQHSILLWLEYWTNPAKLTDIGIQDPPCLSSPWFSMSCCCLSILLASV